MLVVFLRELEYYRGIIILPTNRVRDIDDSVASRIHQPLRYKPVGYAVREGIWEGFLTKANTSAGLPIIHMGDLVLLARKDLYGRQVSCLLECRCIVPITILYWIKLRTPFPQPISWRLGEAQMWSWLI